MCGVTECVWSDGVCCRVCVCVCEVRESVCECGVCELCVCVE